MKTNDIAIFANPFGVIFLVIYGIIWLTLKTIHVIYLACTGKLN